jgi:hypothetical protein
MGRLRFQLVGWSPCVHFREASTWSLGICRHGLRCLRHELPHWTVAATTGSDRQCTTLLAVFTRDGRDGSMSEGKVPGLVRGTSCPKLLGKRPERVLFEVSAALDSSSRTQNVAKPERNGPHWPIGRNKVRPRPGNLSLLLTSTLTIASPGRRHTPEK